MRQHKIFFFIILIHYVFIFNIKITTSSDTKNLKQKILEKQHEIEKKKKEIEKLNKFEKKILNNLVLINNNIKQITNDITINQKKLNELIEIESNINTKIKQLNHQINKNKKYLNSIINILWKTYLHQHFLSTPNNYEYLSLKFKWLTSLYTLYNEKLEEIYTQENELKKQKKELIETKEKIENQLKLIESKKDELLKNKMLLFAKLKEIRINTLKKKSQLDEIIDTVEAIKYKLRILEKKKFSEAKGYLPWPVSQREFKKEKKGIVIKTIGSEPVFACFWGKVVYTGKLRGFGDVVIIFHGNSFYSLYAFLSKSTVKTGDSVNQGDIIGSAGFCPFIKTYGIYFEIRHGKDSMDPIKWLK